MSRVQTVFRTACVAALGGLALWLALAPSALRADAGLIAACEAANPTLPGLCPCAVQQGRAAGLADATLRRLTTHDFAGVSARAVELWGPIFANCTARAVAGDHQQASPAASHGRETQAPQTAGSASAARSAFPIKDGQYGIGPTGILLEVTGQRYTVFDEGAASPSRSVSELRAVAPDVVWLGNASDPTHGNYFCSARYPEGTRASWVQPAWCSEWGYVSGERAASYPPQGDRLRPQAYSLADLAGTWTCQNCSRPWTMTFLRDGTMRVAAADGSDPVDSYALTLLGGRALLRVSGKTGHREALLLEQDGDELIVRYGQYPDQAVGTRFSR